MMVKPTATYVRRLYLTLTLFQTLAASFIWGVNTLFLLDAGLNNTEAFLANAFFTIGQVLFEVPTGMVADLKGRRVSYLLGCVTLAVSTLAYLGAWYVEAPLAVWAIASILLGLGFTFFSGATEAWLVDSLQHAGHKGNLDAVFGQAQVVGGVAMLVGSVAGGLIAQFTSIAVPYVLRAAFLLFNFLLAWLFMKDWGFTPAQSTHVTKDIHTLAKVSFKLGWQNPAVRWVMLAAPLGAGVSFYAFYAMQPFLLKLYGDETAYAVAGLAAAIVAGAQIIGGLGAGQVHTVFQRRTTVLITATVLSGIVLFALSQTTSFIVALGLLCIWGLVGAVSQPVRQAYLNGLIPTQQRATMLSLDSLLGSGGGVIVQPGLGKVADLQGYPASFLIGSIVQSVSLPLIWLNRKLRVPEDYL
jgi:MFS family permease